MKYLLHPYIQFVLLCVFLAGAFCLLENSGKPLPPYKAVTIDLPDTPAIPAVSDTPASSPADTVVPNYELLYENTLFKNTRQENSGSVTSVNANVAADNSQANKDYELIGIACVGQPDKATPIAILVEPQTTRLQTAAEQRTAQLQRMRSQFPGRQGWQPPMPNPPNATATEQGKADETKTEPAGKASRHVVRVGDILEKTGYTVKAISPEKHTVILTRGGTDVTLTLDIANTRQSVRRENAKTATLNQREKQQGITNGTGNAQPNGMPPSPEAWRQRQNWQRNNQNWQRNNQNWQHNNQNWQRNGQNGNGQQSKATQAIPAAVSPEAREKLLQQHQAAQGK